jgi:hypothetical protein
MPRHSWNAEETALMGWAQDMILAAVQQGVARAIIECTENGLCDPKRLLGCGTAALPYIMAQLAERPVPQDVFPSLYVVTRQVEPVARLMAAE